MYRYGAGAVTSTCLKEVNRIVSKLFVKHRYNNCTCAVYCSWRRCAVGAEVDEAGIAGGIVRNGTVRTVGRTELRGYRGPGFMMMHGR